MKLSKTLRISIRIVLLFASAMALSFIPENFSSFFGDWLCNGSGNLINHYYTGCDAGNYFHLPTWHWGYRHWLFLVMGICLAFVQIIDIVSSFDKD